ncbi:hypothetical protein O6P37_12970 [Mycobacterium sp. CPCC 205372]|uniref:Uncharacterized protein n=1 Tax=Mycobacterium hippophais TaxID=3016340 RepID=A0ABT4PTG2_9MYCO|nr:hypothetical protein [Mycobacterium hippophais]MCZ8379779.1 hypothetical protein [Mycobacterium hippophais]
MRLVAGEGLWSTGSPAVATPLTAVLEVSGAVLSWPVDEPGAAAHVAFTDVTRADWLWRVVGDSGHAALLAAAAGRADDGALLEVAEADMPAAAVAPLRRLAVGHWLRRWWPASRLDGIAGLDRALLDAEIALLTAAAEDYFTDDTVDSDAAELLAPHVGELAALARQGDPRVLDIVARCAELAEDLGVAGLEWPLPAADIAVPAGGRDDYALVAGADTRGAGAGVIARGVGPIVWSAVPPWVFDAAEDSVYWTVSSDGPPAEQVRAEVQTALLGAASPAGLPVRVSSGHVSGTGALDADGHAAVPLYDGTGIALSAGAAWDHDWQPTVVSVGADGPTVAANETRETRDRARAVARRRLAQPGDDAFLAEILTAEADY